MVKKEMVERLLDALKAHPTDFASFAAALTKELEAQKEEQVKVTQGTAQKQSDGKHLAIPLSIFSQKQFTINQALTLYLKYHSKQSEGEIAELLGKTKRAITQTVDAAEKIQAEKKQPESFETTGTAPSIPVAIFKKAKPLPALVVYCRDILGLRNKEIAQALRRSEKTISSVYALARGDVS